MKTILITGASSGIGAALARYYARKGCRLLLNGRDTGRLAAVADACGALGAGDIHQGAIDVLDRDVLSHWISGLDKRFPIDTVIANAGISGGAGDQVLEPEEQVRRIFHVTIDGTLNTIQPVMSRMVERGSGHLALMASLASFSGWPGAGTYSAAKAAVRIYGESLRVALKKTGVRVSVLCPGFIDTPMTRVNPYAMPFLMDDERAARIIARGLDRNAGRIAFPWPTYLLSGLIGMLPPAISERVLSGAPRKPAN